MLVTLMTRTRKVEVNGISNVHHAEGSFPRGPTAVTSLLRYSVNDRSWDKPFAPEKSCLRIGSLGREAGHGSMDMENEWLQNVPLSDDKHQVAESRRKWSQNSTCDSCWKNVGCGGNIGNKGRL